MSKFSKKQIENEKHWYAGLDTESKIIANILLRLAKEVDDGIFYAKRKNRLAAFRRQADETGTSLYTPWWGLGAKDSDIALIDNFDKSYHVTREYRDMMKKLEEFRMTDEDAISKKFPYGGMKIRKELEAGDISNIMPRAFESTDFTQEELQNIKNNHAYAPMSSIATMPFQPAENLQDNLLKAVYVGATAGARLLAPGGSGKSTLFMFFGRAAAQHSLSHPTLWWKDEWGTFNYENVTNLGPTSRHKGEYWERRFVKFEASKFYSSEGSGVSEMKGPNNAFLRIATNKKYEDIFVFVMDEFASGLGLDKCKDGGKEDRGVHSAYGQFTEIMKTVLAPGAGNPPSKFISIYAPEDAKCVDKELWDKNQWKRRFSDVDFPYMNQAEVEEAVGFSLFSNLSWKGMLEENLKQQVNMSDPEFNQMYPPEVREHMKKAILQKLAAFVKNNSDEAKGGGTGAGGDTMPPMTMVNFILFKAKERATIRMNLISPVQTAYKNYNDAKTLYEVKLRELNEKKSQLLPKETIANSKRVKIAAGTEDEMLPFEQLQQNLGNKDNNSNQNNQSNQDLENLKREIQRLESDVRFERAEILKAWNALEEAKDNLMALAPNTTFSETFKDAGYVKPIDIETIPDNELTYNAYKQTEEEKKKQSEQKPSKFQQHPELKEQSKKNFLEEVINKNK